MADEKESKIESLGLDEALEDLKFLAQKVSDMSKDLMQKAAEQAEGATEKMGDVVESTGDVLISAGETIKSTKKMFEKD
jgi:hypothetical protein|tara:strand:- start:19926 stop:20162 length:237 start_codon:yes stop_codon:yes gene_type:complete